MITSVNRALDQPYLEDFMVRNAFTAGIDFTQYFKNRLYYIDVKGMVSSLNGSKEAITLLQTNPVHYYQRTSAAGYLGVDPDRRSLNGTGGYVKSGEREMPNGLSRKHSVGRPPVSTSMIWDI